MITDKIVALFSELETDLKGAIENTSFSFPQGTFLRSGKISKGENFQGLPYVILDYPRLFSKDAIFAYRTMFWWGHFFSNTLHVRGSAIKKLMSIDLITADNPLYTQTTGDPWDHSLNSATPTDRVDMLSLLKGKPSFVKITQKLSLEDYDSVKVESTAFFTRLLNNTAATR